jgi:DNA repair protein SbcC/Rad50
MKTITLKSLTMVNFRGIPNLTIDFTHETSIKGANRTGKSTVMMAFSYLLFDKDQFGRKDFEIKPLESTGEAKHQIDSVVSAILLMDKQEIQLKKIYHEKWTKPKGTNEAVFSGHETEFVFNNVPCTMREYNSKIELICPESLFKLLTNPLYFPLLPWTEQRNMLFSIAGQISDSEIASQNKAWQELFVKINGNKTLDEYKREIASEKRKIKDDLDKIPARIDEAQRSIPEGDNWESIERDIKEKTEQMQAIDNNISDISKTVEAENSDYRRKQEAINSKKAELQNIEHLAQMSGSKKVQGLVAEISELNSKIMNLKAEDQRNESSISNLNDTLAGLREKRTTLLSEYAELTKPKEINFLDEEFVCPTCKRALDESDIDVKKEELIAKHNDAKSQGIAKNRIKGLEIKSQIETAEKKIVDISEQRNLTAKALEKLTPELEAKRTSLAEAEAESNSWKIHLASNMDHMRVSREIQAMTDSVGTEPKRINITDQTDLKASLQREIRVLLEKMAGKELIARGEKRIMELKEEQKRLAQQLADLEKVEYNIMGFTRAKIEVIEEKINSMFSLVKWQLFEKQVNGAENETCTLMVDGVPFSDLNNAGRYQAGLDVIRTLSSYYELQAPIFLDNREGVSEIPQTDSQVISLYVDPKYPVLTIN